MKKLILILLLLFITNPILYAGYAPQIKGLDNTGAINKNSDGEWTLDGDLNISGDLTTNGSIYGNGDTLSITGDANISGDLTIGTAGSSDDSTINFTPDSGYSGHIMVNGTEVMTLTDSGVTMTNNYTNNSINSTFETSHSSAIPTDTVTIGGYGYCYNSGTNSMGTGHGIGLLGLSSDVDGSQHWLYGVEGRVNGHSDDSSIYYIGTLGLSQWSDPDSTNGNTFNGTLVSLYATKHVYDYDEATPRNEGTIMGFLIEDSVGGYNNYGGYIADQTAGSNLDVGLALAGADTATLWFMNDSGTANDGIAFGSSMDTNLYRSNTSVLKTDSSMYISGDLTTAGKSNTTTSRLKYKTITSDYTLAIDDYVLMCNSSSDLTITLFSYTDMPDDEFMTEYRIKNAGTGSVFIECATGETFTDGVSHIHLNYQGDMVNIGCGANGWARMSSMDAVVSGEESSASFDINGDLTVSFTVDVENFEDVLNIDDVDNTIINIGKKGLFGIQWSADLDSTGGVTQWNAYGYLQKNGTEISATHMRTGNYQGEDSSMSCPITYIELDDGDKLTLYLHETNFVGTVDKARSQVSITI